MVKYSYAPQGVCSRHISFKIEKGKLYDVKFVGGCPGNLNAIGKLLEGADALKTADMLRGNKCMGKVSSCADQLAHAIDDALDQKEKSQILY